MKRFLLTLAKKSMSLFMACVMLLSCWVFIAPEWATAATSVSYPVTITYSRVFSKGDDEASIQIYYKEVTSTGTFGPETSSQADAVYKDCAGGAATDATWTTTVPGFPTKVAIYSKASGCEEASLSVSKIVIGTQTVTTDTTSTNGGDTKNISGWSDPAVSTCATTISDQTIPVPNGGSTASKTFTTSFKDQYGQTWPSGATTFSASPSATDGGFAVSQSGNSYTITASQSVFDKISGYSSGSGQATTTVTYAAGSVSKTFTVTFQSSSYTVDFNDACGTVHNKTCYYNGTVTPPTACAKDPDNSYHYAFSSWSDTTFSGITANKSVTANYTGTAHTFGGDWVYNGDGTHSKKCTSVGADKTCTIVGLNGKAYGTTGGSAACTGTWTGDGDTHSISCTTCNGEQTHTAVWQEVVATKYQKTAQDCENAGEYYKSCSICGKAHSTDTFKPADEAATGHSYTIYLKHIDHTCTADGYDVYLCENCGMAEEENYNTYRGQEGTDPATHTWETVLSKKDDSTHGYKCSICGAEDAWNEVKEHVWSTETVVKAATCMVEGKKEYTCSCGATKEEVIPVDKVNGHSYSNAVSNNDGATHTATCSLCSDEVTGSCVDTDGVKDCICNTCGGNINHVYDRQAATDAYKASDATCTAKATYYYSCQCGAKGTETFESGSALGHNYTEDSTEVRSNATCDDAQTNWYGCSRCDANAKDDADAADKYYEVGNALGHEASATIYALADGQHGYKCVRYGQGGCTAILNVVDCTYENYTDNNDGTHTGTCICSNTDTADHDMSDWASDDAFGTVAGTQSRHCKVCDYKENNRICNYETSVTPATCITGTITTYTCTDCGHGYSVNDGVKDDSNHSDYGTWTDESTAVASTCTTHGKDADEKCLGCNAVINEGAERSFDYTNHGDNTISVDGYVEATCTIEGHTGKVVCDGCGNTITEDTNIGINANNHVKTTSHDGLAATCEADGYTAYETCDACGIELGKTVLEKLGHNYNGDAVQLDGDKHAYKCERYDDCQSTGVGTTKGASEACSGGKATCLDKAVCDKCKDTHGDYAAHVFDGDYKQVEGTDEHNRLCSVCESEYGLDGVVGASEACSGGKATCLDKAVCDKCKDTHGDYAAHVFDGDYKQVEGTDEHNRLCSVCESEYGLDGVVGASEACSGGKATCLDKAVCDKCKDTHGDYAAHVFDGDYKQVEGTDEHNRLCSVCESEYGLDGVVGASEACSGGEATCLDKAECEFCGGEHGSALGHDYSASADRINKPEDGYHNYKCSRCDQYGIVENDAQVDGGKIACYDAYPVRTAETCTEDAYWTHICDTCAYTWTVTEEGTTLGHNYTEKLVNDAHLISPADCENAAVYWYDCSRCDKNAKNEEDTEKYTDLTYTNGKALGHKFKGATEYLHKATDASCTADETYYVYCTVCKVSSEGTESEKTFVKYDTAPGHQYAEIVDENDLAKNRKSEATCTAAAVYYKSCSVCGAKSTATFTYGDPLGHTFKEKIMDAAHRITAANCITAATYWYDCAACSKNAANIDKTDMTEEEIAALQYTDGEPNANKHSNLVNVDYKAPTCTEDGHSAYQKCEDCKVEIGKVTEGYEKKDHNFTGSYVYDADTDTHKRACLNGCGTYNDAVACSFGSWKQTVDADGNAIHTRECVCGNTDSGDCAGGTATCLEKAKCTTCGKTYGDTLEHKYPDTWTSTGKNTHKKACENGCGVDLTEACSGGTATCKDRAVCDTCKTAYGETTSHTFETYEKISEAKCGVNAKEKATCKYCDATDERDIVGTALQHVMGDYTTDSEYAKAPTCKDEGIEVSCCTREGCNYYVTRTVAAVKDAHVWGEWTVVSGDCATGISEERECSVCGETENRKSYDVEHEYKEVARVMATCLVDGYIEYVCTNCNFSYVYDNTVDGFPGEYSEFKAKGEHTWGEVIETKAPTCANEGRGYQICTVCNAKSDNVAIAKLGHGWEDNDGIENDYIYHAPIDATCDTDGHSGYYECAQCATGKTEPEEIFTATGHADKDGDGKCDSCKGEIYTDGGNAKSCNCICHKENGFMQIIYKIARFFWKLFKIGQSCDCGYVHY